MDGEKVFGFPKIIPKYPPCLSLPNTKEGKLSEIERKLAINQRELSFFMETFYNKLKSIEEKIMEKLNFIEDENEFLRKELIGDN